MRLEGAQEQIDYLRRIGAEGAAAVKEESGRLAQSVLDRAQELCPVKTGRLQRSGRLRVWKNGWDVIFDAEHAAQVHEAVGKRFRNGQAKFLETAMAEHEAEAGEGWHEAFDGVVNSD